MENENKKPEELEGGANPAAGEGNNESDPPVAPAANGQEDKGGNQERTFTQAEVTRMMAREKKQGRNSAYNELGIDPTDKAAVEQFKAFRAFLESQSDNGAEAVPDNTQVDEYAQRALVAETKAEAMMQGVKPQFVDDLVTLVLSGLTEDTDVKDAIGEYRTKYPVWFGVSEEDEGKAGAKAEPAGHKGTGSPVKPASEDKGSGSDKGIGARLAAQRKPGSGKSHYWGSKR